MARGRVTALFADISGFTSLAETMAADELHEVIEPIIARMAAVAERSGGYIAKYAGDALLVFFGISEQRDDDARRAVRAALDMHSELTDCVSGLPGDAGGLTLHVGLATGHVTEGETGGEYAILGDAVSRAQKLESAALSGETFADHLTRELVGDGFTFEPVDGAAVPAWRVLPGVRDESLPSPAGAPTADRAPEEYRLVTSLFADVAGAAELAARLDASELSATVGPIIKRLAKVAEGFSGTIAKYAGDSLLVFFGAPVAHEDHAERALLVATAMQREMDRLLERLPDHARALRLRIGVNTGRVISGLFGGDIRSDYSVLGDSVNLAQRLEAAAPPGETYVGESTKRLTEARFALELVGALRLKGKRQPVPTWRLAGERSAGPRLRAAAPLIGRDGDLAAAERLLASLGDGDGGVLALTGEAGVGKSRLAAEIRARAESVGVRWLAARCISYGAALAYWPYAELFRRMAGIDPTEPDPAGRLRAMLEEAGAPGALPYIARLTGVGLSEGEDEAAGLDPESFRRALHRAVAGLLRSLASQGPVALVLEDLHWGDESSVGLTREVASVAAHAPLLLVLTGRPEAVATVEELSEEIRPDRRAHLALEPLGEDGVRTLVEWMLGGEAPGGLVEAVAARTGGNPFFAEEIVRELRDAGILFQEGGRWRLRHGWDARTVPPTIEGVLSARIDLLPNLEAELLQVAAVMGRRVRLPLLRALVPQLPDTPLARLVELGFLDPLGGDGEDALMFHHALVQDVAYTRLPRRRRRALHLRTAEAGEQIYGAGDDVIDFLARHLYLGDGGAKAVEYLVRAGRRSARLFANEEAILHLGRAAEVAREHSAERLSGILVDLGDLHDLRGEYETAEQRFVEARDMGGDARAWRGIASMRRKRGEFAEALDVLEAAFEATGAGPERALLWLERGGILSVTGAYGEGIEALGAGLEAAPGRRDRVTARLLLELARVETEQGRSAEALEHGRRAESIFDEIGDIRGLAVAMRVTGGAYHDLGLLEEAAEALRRGMDMAGKVGDIEEMAACLVNLGLVELERGNLEEAIECDRRAAREVDRIGHSPGTAIVRANLAEKLLRAGRLAEALAECQTAMDLAREIGDQQTLASALETKALINRARGDALKAFDCAQEAASLYRAIGAVKGAARALEIAASILEVDGETKRAESLRSEALRLLASTDS